MPVATDGHGASRTYRESRSGRRLLLTLSGAWAALLLALYYEQLWPAIAGGPSAWGDGALDELRSSGVPYLREAVSRGVSAVAVAAVIAAAMLAAGGAADRLLTPPGLARHERLAVRFANGAALLSMLLLGLALAGFYRPAVVRAAVMALAALGIAMTVRAWRAPRRERTPAADRRAIVRDLPWMVVTAVAAAAAFVTALAPETEYDALWYHLELPRQWLAAGRLTDNVHEYVSLYPGGWEMLFGAALAFDSPVPARLLHWTTLGASAVAAASLSTRVLGMRTGWIAAAVFVTAPTALWEATTAYVDLALAMHAGIGVGALWRSTQDRDPRWLALAGVQFGMACATKHLGLVIVAIALGGYLVARAGRVGPARAFRAVAVVALLTILIPSPWYVRSWRASGNPVFPEMYGVFGAAPPERWNDSTEQALDGFKARFGRPRTPATLATLPWDMTLHAWRYGGTLGPFLLLTLPATAVVVRRSRPARWLAGGILVYLAVWAAPVSSYQVRFLVPGWLFLSALVAASIALLHGTAARSWRPARRLIPIATAAFLLLNLPPFTPLHERDREGWTHWLTHVVHRVPIDVVAGATSAETYLGRQIRSHAAWQILNAGAPPDARVLTFFGGDHFYAERPRLWSEAPAAWAVTWHAVDGEAGHVTAALHRLGITHLLIPKRPPARTEAHDRLVLLRPETLAAFSLIYEDYWAAVYRVDAPPGRASHAPAAMSKHPPVRHVDRTAGGKRPQQE